MGDYLIRGTAANEQIRAFAVRTTELTEKARSLHHTSPTATAALGRLLAGGAMMGSTMKGERDILTLSIRSDGPLRGITVTADSAGNVKGYVLDPSADVPEKRPGKLDVGAAVGRGILSVSMDLGLKEPYNGQVELQTGEIGDDLAYYYSVSEQTPSAVGLGVKVGTDLSVLQAGGFLIQLMPDAEEDAIAKLEERLAGCEPVTTSLERGLLPEQILENLLGDQKLEITDKKPLRFRCSCSKDRVTRALAALQDDDLQDMIDAGKEIEVRCHFCNTAYDFTVDELRQILGSRKKARSEGEPRAAE